VVTIFIVEAGFLAVLAWTESSGVALPTGWTTTDTLLDGMPAAFSP
jgi:hypothetical protein